MSEIVTTFSCDKCHDVEFLIQEDEETVSFICNKCNEVKATAQVKQNRKIKKVCNCTGLLYKVSSTKNKQHKTFEQLRCEECNNQIKWIPVDNEGKEITEEERLRLLNSARCEQCGSSFFYIDNVSRLLKAKCVECETKIRDIECGDYTSLKNLCSCGSNIFQMLKDESIPTCRECGEKTGKIYVDDDGNEIDKITRELLILQDRCDNLEDYYDREIRDLENRIEELEYKLY